MLISEHVVSHQKSDWGDNINSSQMCSDSYYPQNKIFGQKCKMNSLCTFWASFAFGFWTFLSVWEGFSSIVKKKKNTEIQYYIDSLVRCHGLMVNAI